MRMTDYELDRNTVALLKTRDEPHLPSLPRPFLIFLFPSTERNL